MRCYPLRLRVVSGVLVAAVALGTVIGWTALPAHLRAQFSVVQLATLVALLLALILVIGLVALSYVDAGQHGLVFRNGLRTHRIGWPRVARVSYRSGDPWPFIWVFPHSPATADPSQTAERKQPHPNGWRRNGADQPGDAGSQPEPERLVLLGIQRSDRRRADRAVTQLRRLHATQSHAP